MVVGAPPGTLRVDPAASRPVIRVFGYGPDRYVEQNIDDVLQVRQFVGQWPVTWINVDGLGDAAVLTALASIFGLHRLAMEDVVSLHQRAKVEAYGQHLFIVARMADWSGSLRLEQVSMFVGRDFVLTFQENVGDCLDHIRNRIRVKGGRIREAGADYCTYALLDAIVDNYFPILEQCGERLETIEEEVLARPSPSVVGQLHDIRRDLLSLRRALWPMREAVSALMRDTTPVMTHETRIYLRDCYDHTVQLIEITEMYRELDSALMDAYQSSVNNRMNEVIKVLTIISTIFMPLTFIVGIYGMNFHGGADAPLNMPELGWRYGYLMVMLLMLAVAIAMLVFFRRKGWLGVMDARKKAMRREGGGESNLPRQ
jgi:magnesium transporter